MRCANSRGGKFRRSTQQERDAKEDAARNSKAKKSKQRSARNCLNNVREARKLHPTQKIAQFADKHSDHYNADLAEKVEDLDRELEFAEDSLENDFDDLPPAGG